MVVKIGTGASLLTNGIQGCKAARMRVRSTNKSTTPSPGCRIDRNAAVALLALWLKDAYE